MFDPDYPTPDQLRPMQRAMLAALGDLQPHTIDDLRVRVAEFAKTKRNTLHESIRLLRLRGYEIISPERKMTKPYTFRLTSRTPKREAVPPQELTRLCTRIAKALRPYVRIDDKSKDDAKFIGDVLDRWLGGDADFG